MRELDGPYTVDDRLPSHIGAAAVVAARGPKDWRSQMIVWYEQARSTREGFGGCTAISLRGETRRVACVGLCVRPRRHAGLHRWLRLSVVDSRRLIPRPLTPTPRSE